MQTCHFPFFWGQPKRWIATRGIRILIWTLLREVDRPPLCLLLGVRGGKALTFVVQAYVQLSR